MYNHREMENQLNILESEYHPLNNSWNNVIYIGNYWRFYWNKRRGALMEYQNTTIELEPEKYYLIPPLTSFKARNISNPWHFYFHFTLPRHSVSPHSGPQIFPMTDLIHRHIQDIISQLTGAPSFYSTRGFFSLLQLSGILLMELENSQKLSKVLNSRMEKAVNYIHLHLQQTIKAENLAGYVNMSRSSFFDEFRNYTGLSPNRFIRTIKMENARHRIRHSDSSIEEIADSLGYADRFHFSKTFKKHFGVTPGQYRSISSQS